ncbi:hypothetical protein I4F81_000234 [Pyropia yezoensis]|uniref:Uncharacterized protein n=1 Tax=Pyropia yezoensis TaxID=2788 RepID=A0ACC3BIA3_PYRYE|nr:hypothetical protein I4F81_000234 [Neopyropia yezoensis]
MASSRVCAVAALIVVRWAAVVHVAWEPAFEGAGGTPLPIVPFPARWVFFDVCLVATCPLLLSISSRCPFHASLFPLPLYPISFLRADRAGCQHPNGHYMWITSAPSSRGGGFGGAEPVY